MAQIVTRPVYHKKIALEAMICSIDSLQRTSQDVPDPGILCGVRKDDTIVLERPRKGKAWLFQADQIEPLVQRLASCLLHADDPLQRAWELIETTGIATETGYHIAV